MTADEQIMEQVRAGQLGLLGELFERHHRGLFGYCYGIGGNRSIAEDCVQEAFKRILQYRHSYRGGNFRVWLHRIARNAAMDLLPDQPLDTPVEHVDDSPGPQEQIEIAESENGIHAALQGLSPAYREVLMLARFSGLSSKEIAQVVGADDGTVRVRMHRAMKALSKRYIENTLAEQDIGNE